MDLVDVRAHSRTSTRTVTMSMPIMVTEICLSWFQQTSVHSGDHGGVGSSGEDYTTDREETQSPSSDDVLQRAAAMWILKTKEKHRIPQSSMEAIIRDVQGFLQLVLGEIHSALSSSLSEAALDASSLSSMASIFQPDSIFGNNLIDSKHNIYSSNTTRITLALW